MSKKAWAIILILVVAVGGYLYFGKNTKLFKGSLGPGEFGGGPQEEEPDESPCDLACLDARIAALTQQIAEIEAEITVLQNKHIDLKSSIENEFGPDVAAQTQLVVQYGNELENAQRELGDATKALVAAKKTKNREAIKSAQERVAQAKALVASAKDQLKEAEKLHKELKGILERAEEDLRKLTDKLSVLSQRLDVSKRQLAEAEEARTVAASCPGPYHVATPDGRCVWSCSAGTTPDNATNECACQAGLVETSTDQLGRRVCEAPPPPPPPPPAGEMPAETPADGAPNEGYTPPPVEPPPPAEFQEGAQGEGQAPGQNNCPAGTYPDMQNPEGPCLALAAPSPLPVPVAYFNFSAHLGTATVDMAKFYARGTTTDWSVPDHETPSNVQVELRIIAVDGSVIFDQKSDSQWWSVSGAMQNPILGFSNGIYHIYESGWLFGEPGPPLMNTPGTQYEFTVDPNNQIAETNENDNVRIETVGANGEFAWQNPPN